MTGLKPATPRWESQQSNHAATPTCFTKGLATYMAKQVGVAVWLECWLSHLGVAGLTPGHDNL